MLDQLPTPAPGHPAVVLPDSPSFEDLLSGKATPQQVFCSLHPIQVLRLGAPKGALSSSVDPVNKVFVYTVKAACMTVKEREQYDAEAARLRKNGEKRVPNRSDFADGYATRTIVVGFAAMGARVLHQLKNVRHLDTSKVDLLVEYLRDNASPPADVPSENAV